MDDRHIEDQLGKCWQPQPPAGMRDRVLRRSRQKLAERRRSRWFGPAIPRWQTGLVALGLLAVLLACASDSARQLRLASMEQSDGRRFMTLMAIRLDPHGAHARELERLLNGSGSGAASIQPKGNDTP